MPGVRVLGGLSGGRVRIELRWPEVHVRFMLAEHTPPMAIDERGRWRVDSDEPFNAGLGGFDPQRIHDAMETGGDGCALSVLWSIAAASVVLGVFGPSLFFDVVGGVLTLISLRWTIRRPRRDPRSRRLSKQR